MKKLPITILTILITIIFLSTITNAFTWTQYTNNIVTTNSITKIRTYATYAMGLTNANNILYYNGTRWSEINPPNTIGGTFSTLKVHFDKSTTENGKFYWIIQNTTKRGYLEYDPNTKTWNDLGTESFNVGINTGTDSFACIHDGSGYDISGAATPECYYLLTNGTAVGASYIGDGGASLPNCGSSTITTGQSLFCGGRYIFNGLSWINLGNAFGSNRANLFLRSYNDLEINQMNNNNNDFGFLVNPGIASWNTTNTWVNLISDSYSNSVTTQIYDSSIAPDNGHIYLLWKNISGYYQISHSNGYFSNSFTTDILTTGIPNTIDIDQYNNGNGWAGTSIGEIYQYGTPATINSPGSIDTTFSLTNINLNPNPTSYGTSTTITLKANSAYGNNNNVTFEIYQNLSDILTLAYRYTWTNVANGTTLTKTFSGIEWQNVQPNTNYTFKIFMNNNLGNNTGNYLVNWTITGGSTSNTTGYNQTEYDSTNALITKLLAIDKLGSNRVFGAAIINNSGIAIVTYDITTPNNIIIKTLIVNDTSGATAPTSISLGNNNLLALGTDNELYIYNNTAYGDATRINKIGNYGYGLLSADYVYDTASKDDEDFWTCRQGIITDDSRRFNTTSQTFTDTINTDPCLGINYKNGILFIHKGNSGIKIYNETDQTLITTISGINSQPSSASHDRISIYNNYLYAITGTNQISKYNITDISNPTKISDCNTGYEVISLEALGENEIVVGTIAGLRICDFTNVATYDAPSGKYVSMNLKTYTNGEKPYEIIAMNDQGKYVVAEDTGLGIYYYQKTNITTPTNEPPVITRITTPTDYPCVNQSFNLFIIANDANNDQITYDLDCIATNTIQQNNYISNRFTCNYNTTGTKTIKAFASDGQAGTTKTKTVNAQNCINNNYLNFEIRDYDTPTTLLEDVLVNVIGETSSTTNSAGQTTFNLPNSGTYNVSFSKSGYLTATNSFTTTNSNYVIYLQSTTPTNSNATRNVLFVNLKDQNNIAISEATVSVTDPTTGISTTRYTDITGTATFTDLASGVNLRIGTAKIGYVTQYTNTIIQSSETKTINVNMATVASKQFLGSGRGCKDYVKGVFLCSPLNISGNGDSCLTDSDCITDRCMATVGGLHRTCSNFNYTYCDELGLDQGNTCLIKANAMRGGTNLSDFFLDNFLIVLAVIALSIFIMMWIRSFKTR